MSISYFHLTDSSLWEISLRSLQHPNLLHQLFWTVIVMILGLLCFIFYVLVISFFNLINCFPVSFLLAYCFLCHTWFPSLIASRAIHFLTICGFPFFFVRSFHVHFSNLLCFHCILCFWIVKSCSQFLCIKVHWSFMSRQ